MRRFEAALRCDTRIQYRNGFYWIGLAAAAFWVLILVQIKRIEIIDFPLWLGFFAANNLIMTTFYFAAGLILLEKAEGALDGLVVTPLRPAEYLWSKTLTLSLLAMAETAAALLIVHDGPVRLAPLLLGMGILGGLYTFLGLALVVRYDAINVFLPPSVLWVSFLMVPLLPHFGFWHHPVLELHPAEPGFKLLRMALAPPDSPGLASDAGRYALGAALFWLGASFLWARMAFVRFVTRMAGG